MYIKSTVRYNIIHQVNYTQSIGLVGQFAINKYTWTKIVNTVDFTLICKDNFVYSVN